MRFSIVRLFTRGIFLPLICATALAQGGESPTVQNPVFKTGTNLVLVPALVRTEKGELVFTLTANDFLLTDDGVEQKMTLDEDTGAQPLALVIVAETGGAGAHHLSNYSKISPMLDAVVGNVQHSVAVVGFDSFANIAQEFTPDLDAVTGSVSNLQPGDDGAAILDSLVFAVDMLRKQPPNYRRAILLLSETLDHGSKTKLEDALRAISDTNTAIYSMGFSSTRAELKRQAGNFNSDTTPAPPGGCMSRPKQADDPDEDADTDDTGTQDDRKKKKPAVKGQQGRSAQAYDCAALLAPPLFLAKMAFTAAMNGLHRNVPESVAQLSGGEYYKFENDKAFERNLMTISNHIPNRYVLSFHPQAPHPGLHAIKLQVRDYARLQVTARSSYWVDNDPSTATQ